MKRKRTIKALLLAALLALPFTARAQYLLLTMSDGSQAEFALSEQPVITIADGLLVLTCGERELSTPLDGVSYSFSEEPVAIRQVESPSTPDVSVAFGQAVFKGLKAGSRIAVYTIDGVMVTSIAADEAGEASVDISGLPRGIYVVKAPNRTIKVRN